MQLKIFTIPVFDNKALNEEMNKFLRANTIVDIEKRFIAAGQNSIWTFCIRYLEGGNKEIAEKSPRVDYKEILEPEIFARFSLLRECRKELAAKNGVPVYVVFTNEELATMAKSDDLNVGEISKIKGIGLNRLEKYGAELIEMFNAKSHETTN